jgi:hypothetical protein
VAAHLTDRAGTNTGTAYLFFGAALSGTISLGDADCSFDGEADGDMLSRVGRGGDVNDDGFSDLLLGATDTDYTGSGAGSTYLILGGSGW